MMQSWSEEGFGFKLYNGNNFEDVKKFCLKELEKNKDEEKETITRVEEAKDDGDLWDALDFPASVFIADVINQNEELKNVTGYYPCDDTGAYECIGIRTDYPWTITEREKNMTREDYENILNKYAKELGITEELDFFQQEYYG